MADGTRPHSLESALNIYERVYNWEAPPPPEPNPRVPYVRFPNQQIPFLLLLNKRDLAMEWKVKNSHLQSLRNKGWPVLESSAKTGDGVEEAFLTIGRRMLK